MVESVRKISTLMLSVLFVMALIASSGWAVDPVILRQQSPPSLKLIPIPEPENLNEYVVNRPAAVLLGKALFWDMQVGSDGIVACATCHFHAGADHRFKNQINPGLIAGDTSFQVGGPNLALKASHFPFHQRVEPDFQNSPVVRDANDVVSSMGVFLSQFVDIVPGSSVDLTTPLQDPVFNVGGINTRRVEPRNAPTAINAVFNFANFWDGRANNIFNGVNPFGPADQNARIWANNNGVLEQVSTVGLNNSSLASQAVGPPGSEFEMSARNRPFHKIGKKMLSLPPLAKQKVSPTDSVLGPVALPDKGLSVSYSQLIQQAFNPKYWNSTDIVIFNNGVPTVLPNPGRALTTDEFTQMEVNFSLFFGLAVQLYEATLVSDDTPFDRFAAGDNNALTQQQLEGLDIFLHQGKCINCHTGAEFTSASVSAARFLSNASHGLIETVPLVQSVVIYDQSYYNIAVRPTNEDLGRGGAAPFINPLTGKEFPLAFVALAELQLEGLLPFATPELSPAFPIDFIRASVDGRFKAPGLRNVELTGPFFHDGGTSTLEQAVDFYTRGGNFPKVNIANLDQDIDQIILLQGFPDRAATVAAFMKALTDERVREEMAPFDHPQLFIPNGHPGNSGGLTCINGANACDSLIPIPAVGAGGRPAEGLPPLQPFLVDAKYSVGSDFDEDGKTDIVVYRGSAGAWYMHPSSGAAPFGIGWGGDPTDIPVPGDYDGDGRTDVAIYRGATGAWWIIPSSSGVPTGVGWGGPGFTPAPGDYDGDGKTDVSIYEGATGAWWIIPSSSGIPNGVGWGGDPTDIPVPGDYDGDRKTDVAVYRGATGAWWVIPSSTGIPNGLGWGGNPTDIPVPGDYDGDGKTDIAFYRQSTGVWWVVPSSGAAAYGVGWGGPGFTPVPGDYDGDGTTDVAIYEGSTGVWWVVPSSGEPPFGLGWGGDPSDLPLTENLASNL